MIKEVVADALAPCLRSPVPRGNTPHEQIGIGMPKRAAFNSGYEAFEPRCFFTKDLEMISDSIPAIRNPKRR